MPTVIIITSLHAKMLTLIRLLHMALVVNEMIDHSPKSWRTRFAPVPTNISSNSEPDAWKNGTSASPATARANRDLPVPGGPTNSTPDNSSNSSIGD